MASFKRAALVFLTIITRTISADLVGIPTVPFSQGTGDFDLTSVKQIVVDTKYSNATDQHGYTLIPPSLSEFAATFAGDLSLHTSNNKVDVVNGNGGTSKSIYLTVGSSSAFVDAAGRWTSEAYSLNVTADGVTITGASPLGVWWGTRSVLQQAVLNHGKISLGSGNDAPGWKTRGVMLDCGRHYYPPEFIIEMCNWMSFWKQNTFHIHLSDNLYNNVGIYSRERQLSLYARFRLWSEDPALAGLSRFKNESYTRSQFDTIQSSCAARGVTLIPEIEAPGHALVITQWKPELGLTSDLSLLNISYPDTIPTMKYIWKTFLPWFQTNEVSIGADEYVDRHLTTSQLASAYNTFVIAMNDYIRAAGKSIRIWGTFPPKKTYTNNIPTDVQIQHWAQFEDNAKVDYMSKDYNVINSDDQFYIVNKFSNSYPQRLNKTRIFHGNPADGSAWSPNIYDAKNASNNVERSNPHVVGQIAAQWNDYGANTSTFLEAYYSWRENLPGLADKQWGGKLTEQQYDQIYGSLQAAAPAQDLDRRVTSKSDTIVAYDFSKAVGARVPDSSGNGYDAQTSCESRDGALKFSPQCKVTTPLKSKGADYTLSFSVKQDHPGALLTGPDSQLRSGNGTSTKLMFVSAGNAFPIDYSLPSGEWVDVSISLRNNRTFFSTGGEEIEFMALIGYNGVSLKHTAMALVAPLQTIGGDGWEGEMKSVKLIGTQV